MRFLHLVSCIVAFLCAFMAFVSLPMKAHATEGMPQGTKSSDSFGGGRDGAMQHGNHGGGRGFMGGTTENDPSIEAVLNENASKFEQLVFNDTENGCQLEYSLYVPDDYDGTTAYPLLMFIPDAIGAGKSAKDIVQQYYGATIWVTDEEQAKHPSFVMVPAFSGTVVNDNWNTSEQIESAVHLIAALQETYAIDANRIYTTGQSMGCMTSLYLNSRYPELFAASLFVSGQWDISVLDCLKQQKFFYITAGGDAKASGGQAEVMGLFDAEGVAYSYGSWNAQDSKEDQAAAVNELLAKGLNANMIRFETGTVLNGGNGMEHMASFNYAYKLTVVRDWLYEQTR